MWFYFFTHNTTYVMLICDWSSYVCSSDLPKADVARELGLDDVQPAVVVEVGEVRARLGRLPPVRTFPGCGTETGVSGRGEGHDAVGALQPDRVRDSVQQLSLVPTVVEVGGDAVAVVTRRHVCLRPADGHVGEAPDTIVPVNKTPIVCP